MKKEKLFISKTPSFAYPKAPYPDCVVSGLYILSVCVCVCKRPEYNPIIIYTDSAV